MKSNESTKYILCKQVEIMVYVNPKEITDTGVEQLLKDIGQKIEDKTRLSWYN